MDKNYTEEMEEYDSIVCKSNKHKDSKKFQGRRMFVKHRTCLNFWSRHVCALLHITSHISWPWNLSRHPPLQDVHVDVTWLLSLLCSRSYLICGKTVHVSCILSYDQQKKKRKEKVRKTEIAKLFLLALEYVCTHNTHTNYHLPNTDIYR